MNFPKIIQKIPSGNQILFMESDINYTIIYLSNGKKLISGYNLTFYEKRIDNQCFMRINRSLMIHKSSVKVINFEESALVLNNGKQVSISRRRMKAFQAWI